MFKTKYFQMYSVLQKRSSIKFFTLLLKDYCDLSKKVFTKKFSARIILDLPEFISIGEGGKCPPPVSYAYVPKTNLARIGCQLLKL